METIKKLLNIDVVFLLAVLIFELPVVEFAEYIKEYPIAELLIAVFFLISFYLRKFDPVYLEGAVVAQKKYPFVAGVAGPLTSIFLGMIVGAIYIFHRGLWLLRDLFPDSALIMGEGIPVLVGLIITLVTIAYVVLIQNWLIEEVAPNTKTVSISEPMINFLRGISHLAVSILGAMLYSSLLSAIPDYSDQAITWQYLLTMEGLIDFVFEFLVIGIFVSLFYLPIWLQSFYVNPTDNKLLGYGKMILILTLISFGFIN